MPEIFDRFQIEESEDSEECSKGDRELRALRDDYQQDFI